MPTLAQILGRNLTEHGVSIVNVGGVGLRRFARIFQRKDVKRGGEINIPVACITDLDVMPDCAPEILGKVEPGKPWPSKRRWKARKDFPDHKLSEHREMVRSKASGQQVETFVADQWTLEYDLAFAGLAKEVWVSAQLAKADESIHAAKKTIPQVAKDALRQFRSLRAQHSAPEELCSYVYELFDSSGASKAIAAQYLSLLLERDSKKGRLDATTLRARLPKYLSAAIEYVTHPRQAEVDAVEA